MNILLKIVKVTGMILFSVTFFVSSFAFELDTEKVLEEKIDSIMEEYIGSSVPGAAVVVVKDGKEFFSKGYGFSDIEKELKVEPDKTVFEYGSINKLFVWVSAMQLAEEGKLDLEKNIDFYLPEEINEQLNFSNSITMLDLMNHTAGFEDTLFDFAMEDLEKLPLLAETIQISQPDQVFKPREIISYSNYGSALAAYIIHELSGERFFDYERENIFFPLEMEKIAGHPLYKYNPNLIANKAKGYISEKDGVFKEKGWVYVPAYPSGSADGTATALAKFAIALTPEKPLESPLFKTQEAFEELFKKSYFPENIETSVAHGFWEYGGDITSFGHSGNTGGFTSFFSVNPENRVGLVVLLNSGEETDLIFEIQELIYGNIVKEKGVVLKTPSVKEVSGRYLPSRSPQNNFLQLFSFLSSYKISEYDDGEIKLTIPGHEALYYQVSPYKYNIYDSSSFVIKYLYPELLFEKEEESIKRVTSGNSVDLLPVNSLKPWVWVMGSVIILSTGMLFFLIHPLILIMYKIKIKGKLNKGLIFLSVLGLSLTINNILLVTKAFEFLYYSSQKVQIYILTNIIFSIIFIIFLINMILIRKKIKLNNFNKKNIILYSFIYFLVLATLYNWNFMSLF